MLTSFQFYYRNPRHWDVADKDKRIFRIRGRGCEGLDCKGTFCVIDERVHPSLITEGFKTLSSAVAFITDELMHFESANKRPSTGDEK